jgi:hypothetical protein
VMWIGLVVLALINPGQLHAQAQNSTISCRPLSSGNTFIYPNEQIVGNQACKIVTTGSTSSHSDVVAQPTPSVSAIYPPSSNADSAPRPPEARNGDTSAPTTATATPVRPGVRVAIAPMGGFETYFAAAVREKEVPVTITLNRESAQFFVVSSETEWQGFVYGSGGSASWNQNGGSAAHGSAASSTRGVEASIMLIDANTKDVVWAYEVHKNSHGGLLLGTWAARGQQSAAEACAKHLREFIEKGKG